MQCKGHRFDTWEGRVPRAAEPVSPCATAAEPKLWSLRAAAGTHALQPEGPLQREARAPQRRAAPTACNGRSPHAAAKAHHGRERKTWQGLKHINTKRKNCAIIRQVQTSQVIRGKEGPCVTTNTEPYNPNAHAPSKIQAPQTHRAEAAQERLTLCGPRGCSTPGFPVLHLLLEFAQTLVLRVGDTI